MAKRQRKSTQGSAKPKANGTISITLRNQRYQLAKGKGGKAELAPHPWNQSLSIDGVKHKAGDTFDCPAKLATTLIAYGQAQKAGTRLKPIMPPSMKDREMVLMEGVVRRDDVVGMIPTYDPEKGNKGEWGNAQDMDDF